MHRVLISTGLGHFKIIYLLVGHNAVHSPNFIWSQCIACTHTWLKILVADVVIHLSHDSRTEILSNDKNELPILLITLLWVCSACKTHLRRTKRKKTKLLDHNSFTTNHLFGDVAAQGAPDLLGLLIFKWIRSKV